MESEDQTTDKRPARLMGPDDGVKFTSDYQPSPEAKSEGWRKKKAERLLTQMIIKKIIGENEGEGQLEDYVDKMIELAKNGNPKAIDTINSRLEDEVIKLALTDNEGKDLPPVQIYLPDNGRTNTAAKREQE